MTFLRFALDPPLFGAVDCEVLPWDKSVFKVLTHGSAVGLEADVDMRRGGPQLLALHITAAEGHHVDAADLAALRISTLIQPVSQATALLADPRQPEWDSGYAQYLDGLATPRHPTNARGRKPRSDDELRAIAERFLEIQDKIGAKTGRDSVMQQLHREREGDSGRHIDYTRAWIRAAQRAGWLAPAARGRVERAPGIRLIRTRNEEQHHR